MTTTEKSFRTRLWQMRIRERRTLLVIGDLLAGIIALLLALYYWGVSERFMGFTLEFLQKRVPMWFYLLPLVWLLVMVELYDVHRAVDWGRTVRGVIVAAVIGFFLYLALFFYYSNPPVSLLPRRGVASFLVIVFVLTLLWRWIYMKVFNAPQFMRRALLVGGGNTGQRLLQVVNELKNRTFTVVGIIDDDPNKHGSFIEGFPVIGASDHLMKTVKENEISEVIVAISGGMQDSMFRSLLDAQEAGVEITRMPIAYEEILGRVPVHSLEADWILRSFVDQARVSEFYELGKRVLDIIGGLVGLLLILAMLPIVGLMIIIDDGWPIFYAQERVGRRAQIYNIIKFRTMRRDAEANGHAQVATEDDARATRVGRLLRKTHIDEFPQFINVLRGEMSLVGPRAERPELVANFQKHIPFYRARLLVKPGISGWAQVNFGYASTIEETLVKLEYDLYYIKHRDILTDLVIMLRTPATVLGFRGR